jgi:hypothetical protein
MAWEIVSWRLTVKSGRFKSLKFNEKSVGEDWARVVAEKKNEQLQDRFASS